MRSDQFKAREQAFLSELEAYVGTDYLVSRHIMLGDSTRFDQLNFDIVDEVVIEHLVGTHFGIDGFTCNPWPDTIGGMMSMLAARSEGFGDKLKAFTRDLEEYIGPGYLADRLITIGESTRFDQLNFDIVDEVVTEHLVDINFGLNGFTCDPWPDTMGGLVSMLMSKLGER